MKLLEKNQRLSLEDILVVTEFPPWADAALPFALILVREHGAKMHVAHTASTHFFQKVTNMPAVVGPRRAWRDVMASATARQVLTDSREIAPTLRAMCQRRDFDLVIVSSPAAEAGEPAMDKAAEELLHAADCPVLVFGPGVAGYEPLRSEPATILHATDFSPQALAAAQHAFSWAQEYESWLTMLHVVEGIGAWTDPERARLEEPYRKWMIELVPGELPLWCEVEYRVSFGVAGRAIVWAARELQADVIVLGLSGLDGADATRAGSTVLEVIRQAPCPVLVVRDYMKQPAPLEIARDRRSRAIQAVAA